MISMNGLVSGRRAPVYLVFATALCLLSSACGGGGGGSSYSPGVGKDQTGTGSSGGPGSGSGGTGGGTGSSDVPATTLSCNGFPQTISIAINGTQQNVIRVCVLLQEFAQVTPGLSVTTNAGNLTGHGVASLSSYVVYARVVAQAADVGTATALAKSVVINTANGSVSATPASVNSPQNLEVDFEVFTAPTTNLTLNGNAGNQSVDNYNATLQLTAAAGNVSLTNVQGQVTANTTAGNVIATLSGSSWAGAGFTATTSTGDISVSRPAGYQAAFTATADLGNATIDGTTVLGPPAAPNPAVVTAGSGAPIKLESKVGDVTVTVAAH